MSFVTRRNTYAHRGEFIERVREGGMGRCKAPTQPGNPEAKNCPCNYTRRHQRIYYNHYPIIPREFLTKLPRYATVYLTVCTKQTFNFGRTLVAQKKKTTTAKSTPPEKDTATVTRIKAADTSEKSTRKKVAANKNTAVTTKKKLSKKATRAKKSEKEMGYFKGAWYELRQVRWPNRRTTWALTLAVILFTAFFVGRIILLDFIFQWAFEQLLG